MNSNNSSVSKRIIYFGFNDERRFIVEHLHTQYRWEPVALIGAARSQEWSNDKFPEAKFFDSMHLRKGEHAYRQFGNPMPIDSEVIGSLSKYENNFLGILEDSTGWNFSYRERRTYYFEVLKFWNTVINRIKPDIFVSWTWPHTPMCYPLYLMCKYQCNVDVIFGNPVPLFDNNYHLMGTTLEDYSDPRDPVINLYQSDIAITPKPDIMEHLSELRSDKAKMPKPVADINKRYSWEDATSFRIKHFVQLVLSTLRKGTGFQESPTAWKKNRKPYYSSSSMMNKFEYFIFIEKVRNNNRRLHKIYDAMCVDPDFNSKYLYFAAPYQPEAVTATNAGVYEDLFLALDILVAVLPCDWMIYYKEHPNTFSRATWTRGSLRRDKYYYQRIDAYKKIQIVDFRQDTFQLIDNANAVATVSGSIAWEAVVRGVPALSFGVAWYMGCNSIFKIKTLADAQEVMELILGGYLPDQVDINRYANAIGQVGVKGMVHDQFYHGIKECNDPKFEMRRMAEALYEANNQWYKC